MIHISAMTSNCVAIEKEETWDIYEIETSKRVWLFKKKDNENWLQSAIAKWGYEALDMDIDALDELKDHFVYDEKEHKYNAR